MEKQNNIIYSVIIPAFNSGETITQLCSEIVTIFNAINVIFEIIIVNDGGKLSTWKHIEKIYHQLNCKISIIRLSRNYGQHNATLCGIKNALGEVIITIDDDLQVNPKEILKLIDGYKSNNSDVVYGVYKSKKHNAVRNIGSGLIKNISKLFLNSPGKGSSFRLFKASIAEKILEHSQSFIYIDELLLWYTDNISFVEVEHEKNKKSRYSIISLFKMFVNITTNYTALPLKLITYLGLISSLISFALGTFYIYKKIFRDVPLGYTSIIVAVLFSASIILFSLGVLGQYIYKLYQVQNKKPTFFIKQILSK
ncbi:MAG: glycosyltransferase [Vicingaceae bacterium]|nr:glycosyltransferase [Vicingaceae bacterium]